MSIQNKLLGLIFSVVLVYAAIVMTIGVFGPHKSLPRDLSSTWQAVFLSDGQVYFGHLEDENAGFAKLTSVYYLKYGSSLQQANSGLAQASSSQNLNLVKLGGEVHGPEDLMYIDKDKILFIEILKNTSVVVQAIQKQK